jgi:hypothetical protein
VKLTVVSKIGKEATLGILSEGAFFGEGGLAGQPLRMGSAAAVTDCELMRIEKKAMMLAWRAYHKSLVESGSYRAGDPLEVPEIGTTVRLKEGKRSAPRICCGDPLYFKAEHFDLLLDCLPLTP